METDGIPWDQLRKPVEPQLPENDMRVPGGSRYLGLSFRPRVEAVEYEEQ
ncbi:hypothetical protein AAW51_2062 [Caldimonas brevitalea]|uniref:Uncharacterized protein n=1 Tax=Caldimonas brevitalea TaxID=413882 RepID=A0A0G3BL83_9BURK|nr:hypothetical protein AAW51_2062 [Caldimonas brevitalea]